MFNFPTNIRSPGFRVGIPDDETDQNKQADGSSVPGFRVGLPDDGSNQNNQADGSSTPASTCRPLGTILTAMHSSQHQPSALALRASILEGSFG